MELSLKNMALISLTNVWVVQLLYAEIKHYGLNFTRHVMSFGYEIVPVFLHTQTYSSLALSNQLQRELHLSSHLLQYELLGTVV